LKSTTNQGPGKSVSQILFPPLKISSGGHLRIGLEMVLARFHLHLRRHFVFWIVAASMYFIGLAASMVRGLEWEALRSLAAFSGSLGADLPSYLVEEWAPFLPPVSLGILALAAIFFLRSGPRWAMEPSR